MQFIAAILRMQVLLQYCCIALKLQIQFTRCNLSLGHRSKSLVVFVIANCLVIKYLCVLDFTTKSKMNPEEIQILSLIIILGGAYFLMNYRTNRQWWTRPWIRKRDNTGNLRLVHDELAKEDARNFKNFLRMNQPTFEYLLEFIKPSIEKQDTTMRTSISAKDRSTVTLRYLATGESYKSLMFSFRIGDSTISKFIPEVCCAIYNSLKEEYLKTPATPIEWLNIAKELMKNGVCRMF
ncbi:hypothetical protein FQR65_LT16497 [Abscondita terminalis]|nr:hypothetical protein FQR65_LT16497 [Abscondita terminalis]